MKKNPSADMATYVCDLVNWWGMLPAMIGFNYIFFVANHGQANQL